MAHVSGEWQQALGSELNAGGNLTLDAGRDVTFTGSWPAPPAAPAQAGGDINIRPKAPPTPRTGRQQPYFISQQRPPEERLTVSALGGDQASPWRATACWPKARRLTVKRGVLASARGT
ncbi:hemagglutinin repeat-containing protein [Serratia ureilytica]